MWLAVIVSVCTLFGVIAVVVWALRRYEKRYHESLAELRGRYEGVVSEKGQMLSRAESDANKYKERVTELDTRLTDIHERLRSIGTDALGQVATLSRTIEPVIAMFKTPQTAGIAYAEASLEVLLETHLGSGLFERKPKSLAVGNETVDFVMRLPDCTVPIDSKFPEQRYRQWVEAAEMEQKARWRDFRDAILEQLRNVSKYIHPELGTTDFALLFVPTDAVWHQAFVVNKWYGEDNPIPQKSQELRVFGCSAQTLMPYLGLLRLGLRNLRISEDIKGVERLIGQLGIAWGRCMTDWGTLMGHLRNAHNFAAGMAGPKGNLSLTNRVVDDLSKHGGEGEHESETLERSIVERPPA